MSETIANPIFDITMPVSMLSKGDREHRAFLRLPPELLASHRGEYVAIHNGQVVDSDGNDIVLIQRIHVRVGYVPLHVGLVSEERQIVLVPHYREYRPVKDRS